MKKLIYSLVITFLMGLSVNTFAQKAVATMAYLNVKTSKKVVDDKTAIVSFQLNNISDEATLAKYKKAFSSQQRIQSVTTSLQKGNMASFYIKMDKTATLETLQRLFVKAHVASVNVDGKVVATKDLSKLKQKSAKK